jgi:hypothetical protein
MSSINGMYSKATHIDEGNESNMKDNGYMEDIRIHGGERESQGASRLPTIHTQLFNFMTNYCAPVPNQLENHM